MEKQIDEERLRNTTDVTVWAEEFCKFFDGWEIITGGDDRVEVINEGTMIGWFANYAQASNDRLIADRIVHPGTWYAFKYFYYLDQSNAAMHQGLVRFSPITFRLAEFMWASYPLAQHPEGVLALRSDPRLNEVMEALGTYPEDRGREAVE